jgi:nitrous oxidase accessory protein
MEGHQPCKIIIVIALMLLGSTGQGRTLSVKPGSGTRIQEAILSAGEGDTVVVNAGTYANCRLEIRKRLVLRGAGWPVLDGAGKHQVITVYASGTVIEGLALRHSGASSLDDIAGLRVVRAHQVTLRNNRLTDTFFGIYFQECRACTATGNTLQSFATGEQQSGDGVHCWKSDSLQILRNDITGYRDGIYFEFVTNSSIRNNHSRNNLRYGLHFMFSHHNDYVNNEFRHNGAGVAVMYTHHVDMIGNTFIDNWGPSSYGLLMKEITDSRISGNRFVSNTSAIYFEGTSRMDLSHNVFERNGCALRIQASCQDNNVIANNFLGNTFDVTTNGSLSMNTFADNYWDKYEGYDLDHDGHGDVPYHPVSLYSMILEKMPVAVIFLRSFMVALLDKTEKAIPGITPQAYRDDVPRMKPVVL